MEDDRRSARKVKSVGDVDVEVACKLLKILACFGGTGIPACDAARYASTHIGR
jgi:hypothetical protein